MCAVHRRDPVSYLTKKCFVFLIDDLHTIQSEQTIHDEDEECRIFSGLGKLYKYPIAGLSRRYDIRSAHQFYSYLLNLGR
jgi:hypothetical protein